MIEGNTWFPTEKNIEDYELLDGMLYSQKEEFDILSKKKANEQLNPLKIKMVNRVLEPLKNLFSHEASHKFLDTLDEEVMPTNSDVVLIISQYQLAIREFRKRYYIHDSFQHDSYGDRITRWMTEECPPDYFADEEDYDEDEE